MLKRNEIKGFTLKLFNIYIEFVFIKGWIKVIAINKGLRNNTFYLLDN